MVQIPPGLGQFNQRDHRRSHQEVLVDPLELNLAVDHPVVTERNSTDEFLEVGRALFSLTFCLTKSKGLYSG